jgi:hypothetical protein
MDTDSFSMWLIDTGKLTGCTLGDVWQEFREIPSNEYDAGYNTWLDTVYPFMDMSVFHAYLAKKFPKEFTVWKTLRRLACSP